MTPPSRFAWGAWSLAVVLAVVLIVYVEVM
jgi:hypothetical protein